MVLSRGRAIPSRLRPQVARQERNYLKKKEKFIPSYYRGFGGLQIVREGNLTLASQRWRH
jgi:hypothetical protein